jgi:hypothetical protein
MPDSESTIDVRGFAVWTFRNGRVLRFEVLGAGTEYDEARRRAGIAKPDGTG